MNEVFEEVRRGREDGRGEEWKSIDQRREEEGLEENNRRGDQRGRRGRRVYNII